jgi:hypothetical protein
VVSSIRTANCRIRAALPQGNVFLIQQPSAFGTGGFFPSILGLQSWAHAIHYIIKVFIDDEQQLSKRSGAAGLGPTEIQSSSV